VKFADIFSHIDADSFARRADWPLGQYVQKPDARVMLVAAEGIGEWTPRPVDMVADDWFVYDWHHHPNQHQLTRDEMVAAGVTVVD
jgi:hypothetical protein